MDSRGRQQFQVSCSQCQSTSKNTIGKGAAAAAATRRPQPQHTTSLFPPDSRGFDIQPLEPMLLPKLRIYFADFPWLHGPIDQRLFTSESRCGFRYGPCAREGVGLRRIFHEDNQGTERYKDCIAFSMFSDVFHQLKCHSRRQRCQREKRTLHRPDYPSIRRC